MGLTRPRISNIDTSLEYTLDPIVTLNSKATLANTDVGFVFNRNAGISSNTAFYWNETLQSFTFSLTSSGGLVPGNIVATSYANITARSFYGNLAGGTTGDTYITGNLIPTANSVYNLGSTTSWFKSLYLSGNTIYLGGQIISATATGFSFQTKGGGRFDYDENEGGFTNFQSIGGSNNTKTSFTDVAISGYLNASGNILSRGAIHNSLTVNGTATVNSSLNVTGNILAGNVTFNSVTASTLNVAGGGLNSVAIGQTTAAAGSFTTLTASSYINSAGNVLATSGTFNTLSVNGNESISGYLNVTGNILSTGAIHNSLTVNGGITSTGVVNTSGNVLATSGIFNALTVNGSATITGNLYVQGNVTTISSNNITLEDSLIYLADGNPADLTDIGIVGSFTDAVRYQHTGLARDATDGQWKLFANVTTEPSTNVIDFTNASYSNLRIGNLTAVSANLSGTLTTTGNITTSVYLFGNGSTLTGIVTSVTKIINGNSNITSYENGNIAVSVQGTGNTVVFSKPNVYISGSIIPSANITYDLGSTTNRFRSAYFSGSTIYLGNVAVSESTLAAINSFPTGDYGDVSASSSDAFGVSTVATFDLNAAGSVTSIDLGELT